MKDKKKVKDIKVGSTALSQRAPSYKISKTLLKRGTEVFESEEKFLSWLNRPCIALGSITPLSLLDHKAGIQEVMDQLGRIEYGVYC